MRKELQEIEAANSSVVQDWFEHSVCQATADGSVAKEDSEAAADGTGGEEEVQEMPTLQESLGNKQLVDKVALS